jgi:hypothetical protein
MSIISKGAFSSVYISAATVLFFAKNISQWQINVNLGKSFVSPKSVMIRIL